MRLRRRSVHTTRTLSSFDIASVNTADGHEPEELIGISMALEGLRMRLSLVYIRFMHQLKKERETLGRAETLGQHGLAVIITRYHIQIDRAHFVPYEGSDARTHALFPDGFMPSFGSGLAFKGRTANGDLEFFGLSDRGPNGEAPQVPSPSGIGVMDAKFFAAPGFTPAVGLIRVGAAQATLAATLPLKLSEHLLANGLPPPPGRAGHPGEVPLLDKLAYDPVSSAVFSEHGVDSEAIAYDARNKRMWISDEYGPYIVGVDPATGILQKRYGPGHGLPGVIAKRRANRGLEGMTYDSDSGLLHAFLQSPLSDGKALYAPTGKEEKVERHARFLRWIEFDPDSGSTTRMLAYPLDGAAYHEGRTGNAKLGDLVALGGGKFVVIEQGEGRGGKMVHQLLLVEIGAASALPDTADLERSSMAGCAVNGTDWSQIVPMKKSLLLDLTAVGWFVEKAEGLALVDAHTLALASDSDFGMKMVGEDDPATMHIGLADPENRVGRIWLLCFEEALASLGQ